jgi:hypothetical protein
MRGINQKHKFATIYKRGGMPFNKEIPYMLSACFMVCFLFGEPWDKSRGPSDIRLILRTPFRDVTLQHGHTRNLQKKKGNDKGTDNSPNV